MTRLLPTPSLWRRAATVLHQNKSTLCATSNTPASAFRPVQAGAKYGPVAAMSDSVSRSSTPLTAAYRGVAHLFLTGMSALPADQRRTDEASRPDWANYLPGHPASFVRFVRTVGSPQSCSGARYRRSLARVDSWPKPSRSCPTIQVLF